MLWCLLDPDTFEIEQKYTTEEMRKELKKDNIKVTRQHILLIELISGDIF